MQHAPQAQGEVRFLSSVFAGLFDRRARQPKEIAAGARDFAERNGFMAEKARGERIHAVVVAGRARVERVRQKHGVVDRRDANAAHRQHMHVELDIVADLEDARRLEQRLQKRDRFGFRDLVGREAGAIEQIGARPMADRDVAGLPRPDREREADELALQRVGRVRLGVDSDDALVPGARDPCAELGGGADDLVGCAIDRSARVFCPRRGKVSGRRALRRSLRLARRGSRGRLSGGRACCRRVSFSFQKGHALAAGPRRGPDEARVWLDRRHVDAADLRDAARERRELHRLAKRDEPLTVELRRRKRLERRLDRHVPIQGDELLRHADKFNGVWIGQHVASLGLFDFARPPEQRLEIPVFGNELGGGLEADAGRARHIVGRIAGERLDVDHPVRANAEIFDHLGRTEAPLLARAGDACLARSRVVHRNPRVRRAA